MNWLMSLGPKFLSSKISGWIALGAVSLLFAAWWRYDYITDQLAECRADAYIAQKENPELDKIADDLKAEKAKEFDALRDDLDNAEHPCLEWVYPVDEDTPAPEGSSVRDS